MLNQVISVLLSGWLSQLLYASIITVFLTFFAFMFAMVIGGLFLAATFSKNVFLRLLASIYLTIFRGIPELLIIYFVFYVGSDISNIFSSNLNMGSIASSGIFKFFIGAFALGLIMGSYLTEIFRGAFLAINHGQIEAGKAIGMNNIIILQRIIIPQTLAYAWQGITNTWLLGLKDTSLVSIIGLTELMFKTNLIVSSTSMPFLFYFLAGIMYLLMAYISDIILKKISPERKLYLGQK